LENRKRKWKLGGGGKDGRTGESEGRRRRKAIGNAGVRHPREVVRGVEVQARPEENPVYTN